MVLGEVNSSWNARSVKPAAAAWAGTACPLAALEFANEVSTAMSASKKIRAVGIPSSLVVILDNLSSQIIDLRKDTNQGIEMARDTSESHFINTRNTAPQFKTGRSEASKQLEF
jgi:hypothetical protein